MQIKYLKNKIKISLLTFFKYYIDKFKYKNNKNICICINNNNKYIDKKNSNLIQKAQNIYQINNNKIILK